MQQKESSSEEDMATRVNEMRIEECEATQVNETQPALQENELPSIESMAMLGNEPPFIKGEPLSKDGESMQGYQQLIKRGEAASPLHSLLEVGGTMKSNEPPLKKLFDILIMGTPGVGKSALVDALLGKPVTKIANQFLCVEFKSMTHFEVDLREALMIASDLPHSKQESESYNMQDLEPPYEQGETVRCNELQKEENEPRARRVKPYQANHPGGLH
ncbi:hypothetical protein GBAR_LOCUS20380 [Geodia barretti]|uniref:Uncharacterized protein n=1 Tax=Geodia barretti TaxID=519541 RepID=A0AA35X1E6_GEOBA|nr:hypothetical protein GBAR_LOCUS20380 [Geodia barretti]